jgi:hypothetical protein
MLRHHAALVSGKLTRVPSGVNFPPSEVIMSRRKAIARRIVAKEVLRQAFQEIHTGTEWVPTACWGLSSVRCTSHTRTPTTSYPVSSMRSGAA